MLARLVRTRRGASVSDLAAGGVGKDCTRLISGSVLDGHTAVDHIAYLGRYHNQISAISDVVERPFLGWLAPGAKVFSAAASTHQARIVFDTARTMALTGMSRSRQTSTQG